MSLKQLNGALVSRADMKTLLNKMNSTAAKVRLGEVLDNQQGQAQGVYSFAVQGGAVGLINLKDSAGNDLKLPNNAIIQNVLIHAVTAPTSAGAATVGFQVQAANDILADTAIASVTGRLQGIPDDAVANMIRLTAERTVQIEIAVAALTAGKINLFIDYVISE